LRVISVESQIDVLLGLTVSSSSRTRYGGFSAGGGPEVDQRKVAVQIIALTERLDTSGRERENGETAKRNIREDEVERVAECHCGRLRAITSGEPDSVYICHWKACQRRTGAVIHNGSRWLKSQVRITGEHKIYGRIADSGFEIRFHFCPNCGSSVFWEGDRSPTTYGIAVGCFADPDFPAPTSSGWEESMHRWLGLPPGTAHFLESRS